MAFTIDENATNSPPPRRIMYMIHHIFLPPKLPLRDDYDLQHDKGLLDTTIEGLREFKQCVVDDQDGTIDSVIHMVTTMRTAGDSFDSVGAISEDKLGNALRDLCKKGGTLSLHIRAQNAGVMISRVDESIQVEVFELSPLNQPVLTTKGRLRRSFPGPAYSLSIETFQQSGFLETMAHTLAKMSHQAAVGTKPKVKKAARMHDEDRDTTHPNIITELFVGSLRSVAEPADVSRLWKNTREEIMWQDSLLPWRRSPLWLLVRTSVQLTFSRSSDLSDLSQKRYKMFVVFLMSYVLQSCHQYALPSDLLYAMNAKLARRLLKLGPAVDQNVVDFVSSVMQDTHALLRRRWSNIMERADPHYVPSWLKRLSFDEDICITLLDLEEHIKSLARRVNQKSSVSFQPAADLVKYQAERLPTRVGSSTTDYMTYNLRAFKDWVASGLHNWLADHKGNDDSCGELSHLIRMYHGAASPYYYRHPEAISIMLLTILELWIACDESVVHTCALLRDYDPGVPLELFQSLLLPFKCQMGRLLRAENYLRRRQAHARFRSPRIFRDYGLQDSFSVRYFNQSAKHQSLFEEIERQATQAQQEKRDELQRKKLEYESLMRLYDEGECEYLEVIVDHWNNFTESRHDDKNCQRCAFNTRAASLDIQIHEWPLPSDKLEARSTVFELSVPSFFGHWRDTTVFLLLDVLRAEPLSTVTPRANQALQSYQGLSSYFVPFDLSQRIGLLSENKSHLVTHRRKKSIGITTEGDICLNNGLWYQYYDGCHRDFCRRLSYPG